MKSAAFKENTKLAFSTLAAHKFRTFLTILGVFIGVVVIIGVASVLNGFRQSVIDQVEEFGTNNIYVYRYPFVRMGRLPRNVRNRKPLKLEDAWALRELCPSVRYVAPALPHFTGAVIKYRGEQPRTSQLRGVFAEGQYVFNSVIREGRYFTEPEVDHAMPVTVLGYNVADGLFPRSNPVDKEITIDGKKFRVIGTLEKMKEGPFGQENEADNLVFIPYYTFRKMYPAVDDHFIAVQAYQGKLPQAIDEITQVLRRRRGVKYNEENNFAIGTADSIIEAFDEITGAALAVMFIISTVAFLVGGIGVMNIMLVSVTERTREIGIRKAIGARRGDVIWQFLTEAMTMTGIGGVAGILFGVGLVQILERIVPKLPTNVPAWAVAFGFLGSVGVGLFFGMWPAVKASRLDPIEALRHE
ncbi:MAG: ABC transporter permease [Acidobacteria bacterium]|nr:ABC transporter permease [Acidobacteriota bacterium]